MDIEYVRDGFKCPHEECEGTLILKSDFQLYYCDFNQETKAKVQAMCQDCDETFEVEFSVDSILTVSNDYEPSEEPNSFWDDDWSEDEE